MVASKDEARLKQEDIRLKTEGKGKDRKDLCNTGHCSHCKNSCSAALIINNIYNWGDGEINS